MRSEDFVDRVELEVVAEFEKPQDAAFVAHVAVPRKEDLEKVILEKRKRKLMEKYVTKNLDALGAK